MAGKKNPFLVPYNMDRGREILNRHLSPELREEIEWAPRKNIQRTSPGQRIAGTERQRVLGYDYDDISTALAPEIKKANWANKQARLTKSNQPSITPTVTAPQSIATQQAVSGGREAKGAFDNLKKEAEKQKRLNKKFVNNAKKSIGEEVVQQGSSIIDQGKIASNLDEIIDLRKAKMSLGATATFGILGLDLLAAENKTSVFIGMGGMAAGYALASKTPWWGQLGGALVGYATGRFLGSGLTKAGNIEIDGLSQGGFSGALNNANYDNFVNPRFARNTGVNPLNQQRWRDTTYKVNQPNTGSFTVGHINHSMEQAHSPKISGLYEGGMAASERHMNSEFGSGWLSKAWGGIRKMFGGGVSRGIRRQADMSPALHNIMTTGGATGRDFARKRLGGERGLQIVEKYFKESDIILARGEQELIGAFASRGFSEDSASTLAKHYLKQSPAGYIPKLKGMKIDVAYVTDKDEEILKIATEGKSRWQLLKEGRFREAMTSPDKLVKEVKAAALGHEALEAEFYRQRRQDFSTTVSSHETPRIYRAEAQFNTMLGRTASDAILRARSKEFPNVISASTGKVRDAISEQIGDLTKRTLDPRSKKLNRVVGDVGYWEFKEEVNRLSRFRTATAEIRDVYKREGLLSRRNLGRIKEAETEMKERLGNYASSLERYSDEMMRNNPDQAHVLRRHAERTRNLKQSRVRTLSKEQIAERFTEEAGILTRKKQLGKLEREAQVQQAANTRNSISRANQSRDVPGLAQTGEAAKLHGDLGYHSGIDPFRKFLASIGKDFNTVRGNVHFQRAISQGKVLEKIGQAGVGAVHKMEVTIPPEALGLAEDYVGEIPKLKYLRKGYLDNVTTEQRTFLMEAEAKGLKAIEDTLAPSVYGTATDQSGPVLYMEYIEEAETLNTYLKKGNKFTDKQFMQLEDALNDLHRQGLSHGDFGSANVMINKQGQPFIIDPMPSRYSPGLSLSDTDLQTKAMNMVQDKMGLELMERRINKNFEVQQEASQFSRDLWMVSNARTIPHGEGPFKYEGEVEKAWDIVSEIGFRAKGQTQASGLELASSVGHGNVPSEVIIAGNQSDLATAALSAKRKKHFNQVNQELLENTTVALGNKRQVSSPGRRHTDMDSQMQKTLELLQ